jgi:hypothetical protein
VLVADVRDTAFQTNPFDAILGDKEKVRTLALTLTGQGTLTLTHSTPCLATRKRCESRAPRQARTGCGKSADPGA